MSGIEVFDKGDWTVRSTTIDGEVWFVAADVADALGLARHQDSTRYLDDDERGVCSVDTPSGQQQMTVVSEAGLYSMILRSRLESAKAFKRWITHEVIPQIRRTGSYSTAPALPAGDMLAHLELAVAGWRTEREARELAEAKVAELEPVVEAIEQVVPADGDYSVREAAKLLEPFGVALGPQKLWDLLRTWRWVFGSPPQAYADLIREGSLRHHPTGGYYDRSENWHSTWQVRVTGKGLLRIARKLGKAGPGPLAVVS